MSEFHGVLTEAGEAKMAAAVGGTPLSLSTIRVGDGAGAQIVPVRTMTDLARRVGDAYPIQTSSADPVNASYWRVTALIPYAAGPFDIREIAVFDTDGDMIAIANHPVVQKRGAGQGIATEIDLDIVFPVLSGASITVTLAAQGYATVQHVAEQLEDYVTHPEMETTFLNDRVSIARLWRVPWLTVNSVTVTAPPGAPTLGDTYVVPVGATGAWSAQVGKLAQWITTGGGSGWIFATAPLDSIVGAQDTHLYWQRKAAGWQPWGADNVTHAEMDAAFAADRIAITRPWRLGFMAVNSVTVTAPPGAPTLGDTYIVPAGATGAWNGQADKTAQWVTGAWVFAQAPLDTLVCAQDTHLYWQRKASGWQPALRIGAADLLYHGCF